MQYPKNFLAFLGIIFYFHANAQYRTTLKGDVHDRDSKTIYLLPRHVDSRFVTRIAIPIQDGHFEYTMNYDEMKAYRLVFAEELDAGVYNSIDFFPDSTEVIFHLYPMAQHQQDRVDGGPINTEWHRSRNIQDSLFGQRQKQLDDDQTRLRKQKLFFCKAYDSLIDLAIHAKDDDGKYGHYQQANQLEKQGRHLAPAGIVWQQRSDSLRQEIISWKYDRMNAQLSFANYYLLFEDALYNVQSNPYLLNPIQQTYQKYVQAYPSHEYSGMILDALRGRLQIFPGQPFVDFTAPDMQGRDQHLSALIRGRLALLDFWGSWCGNCITNSRKMQPLYERYKDKGFTIVGVAREYRNTKKLIKCLGIEKFPWINLVELDDKNGIWNKYGVQNNAGLMVLIDAGGKILSIDPTPEEVARELAKLH